VFIEMLRLLFLFIVLVFVFKTGSCFIAQAGTLDPSASASCAGIIGMYYTQLHISFEKSLNIFAFGIKSKTFYFPHCLASFSIVCLVWFSEIGLASSSCSFCLSLPNPGITGVHHHACPDFIF
jgi:hypothetical protein